jgi:hypothetical protein
MSYKKLFWGVLLIIIGLLIVLKNLDVIYFTWYSVLRLWPLLLVLWGISIIPVKDWIKLVSSLVVIVLAFILLSSYGYDYQSKWFDWPFRYHFRSDRDMDDKKDRSEKKDYEYKSQTLTEHYDSAINNAKLRLDAAAGNFDIVGTTDQLIEFDKSGYLGDYSMTTQDLDDKYVVSISLIDGSIRTRGKNKGDQVNIRLNAQPVWDFDFDIGAASFDIDLSNFKTRDIEIDGGAASIDLTLGDEYENTYVNIDAGASSVTINIPEESGCKLYNTTVLSSKSLSGFDRINRNNYQTDNYDESDNKIEITVDAAVSSLTVLRY